MEEPGLKDTEEFGGNVEQNKSTIHFKIGLCKFSKKMSSSQKLYVIFQLFQNSMQKQCNIIVIDYKTNTLPSRIDVLPEISVVVGKMSHF